MSRGLDIEAPDHPATVALVIEDESRSKQAPVLMKELGLTRAYRANDPAPELESADFLLILGSRRMELRESPKGSSKRPRFRPIFVDFLHSFSARGRQDDRRRQPLSRAIGTITGTTVVDATAGLARDSFLLASLGCRVIALERSKLLAVLIRDGLDRGFRDGGSRVQEILSRIELIVGDARSHLPVVATFSTPDVVYLDPMYPARSKSALGARELRVCRRLVGDDHDAAELLDIAMQCAARRVVVKRPRLAPPLRSRPTCTYVGNAVRYDAYVIATEGKNRKGNTR